MSGIHVDLANAADYLRELSVQVERLQKGWIEVAARVADQVSAKARPGKAKDTADEIGRRIRALKEEIDE